MNDFLTGCLTTVPEEEEQSDAEDQKSKLAFLKKLPSLKVHQIVFP